jgi:hypothetical protein
MENSFHGTLWNACLAVNALVRVNVEHFVAFVEALYRANNNAIGVLATKARLGNDMSHDENPSSQLSGFLWRHFASTYARTVCERQKYDSQVDCKVRFGVNNDDQAI